MQFKIIKSLIISLSITFLTFQSYLYSSDSTEDIEDYGIISLMYHRFEENKYPSTNIRIKDFLEHIKIIEENKPQSSEEDIYKVKKNRNSFLLKHWWFWIIWFLAIGGLSYIPLPKIIFLIANNLLCLFPIIYLIYWLIQKVVKR